MLCNFKSSWFFIREREREVIFVVDWDVSGVWFV